MSVPVEVPALGESITEAIVAEWVKNEGDFVNEDEILVELETDKITVSVPAPVAGVLKALKAKTDQTVNVGDVIAEIEPGDKEAEAGEKEDEADDVEVDEDEAGEDDVDRERDVDDDESTSGRDKRANGESPAVSRLLEENDLAADQIDGSGPDGRVLKGDVLAYLEDRAGGEKGDTEKTSGARARAPKSAPDFPAGTDKGDETTERVKMSRLRQTVAKRLVQAQQEAAMLTTFNEVDMSAVMELRGRFKEQFAEKYDVKLGFMSFFVKACINALKAYPAVNSEIDGDEIVYKNFFHVGVAVGGPRGLVVPVIKHADRMSFAEVELEIGRLAEKVRENRISLDDLQGGTFTISNGGIYGSMLSTPIVNPPQVGILGMHNIVERPVVVDGEIVVRPIMYLALSYDHRIIDGKEAVSFLRRVKECIEDPERILLEI